MKRYQKLSTECSICGDEVTITYLDKVTLKELEEDRKQYICTECVTKIKRGDYGRYKI